MARISAWRIAAAIVLVALVFVIAVLFVGRNRLLGLISTRDWVTFQVPPNAVSLKADLQSTSEGITVCDRGLAPWSDVLIQINGLYVVRLQSLGNGDCENVAFSQFQMKTWKHNRGYSNMHVSRIEVLASESRRGYARRDL